MSQALAVAVVNRDAGELAVASGGTQLQVFVQVCNHPSPLAPLVTHADARFEVASLAPCPVSCKLPMRFRWGACCPVGRAQQRSRELSML